MLKKLGEKMTINISGNNVELNDDLKSYAQEKVLKFVDMIEEPAVCDIMLSNEFGPKGGEDKLVRITMSLPGEKNAIHVESQTDDFFGSIDLVQEKLAREIEKYKEKVKIGDRRVEEE
jgi:putative sigma-54 modulation protein